MFVEIHDSGKTLPFVIYTIGESLRQSPVDRPRGYPMHHLLWVTRGSGVFICGGEEHELHPNDGFFCRSDVAHSYRAEKGEFSTRWATFSGGEGVMDYYHAPEWFPFHASSELIAATAELEKLCMGNSTPLTRSVEGYRWFSQFMTGKFAPSSVDAFLQQYIETHFAENISLDDLAGLVHMNRFSLCRFYQKTKGITLMEHLKQIRLAKARELLRYTTCSVDEVSRMCGYHSCSYFGKLFHDENGVSPLTYREEYSKKEKE